MAPLDPAELAPSGLHVLDDQRRYSKASIGQMELLDELDTALHATLSKIAE